MDDMVRVIYDNRDKRSTSVYEEILQFTDQVTIVTITRCLYLKLACGQTEVEHKEGVPVVRDDRVEREDPPPMREKGGGKDLELFPKMGRGRQFRTSSTVFWSCVRMKPGCSTQLQCLRHGP